MKKFSVFVFLFLQTVLCIKAQNVPAYVPTGSLVAWYPFTGNALDSSGNMNHATYTGTGVVLATDRFNQSNSCYDFAGNTGDYIRVPADNFPSKDRTVALWFNVPTVNNRPILLGYGGGGNLGYGTSFLMGLNILGWGSYHCQAHFNSNQIEHTYTVAPLSSWHHFAVTVSGATMTLYVDGIPTQTNTAFTYSTVVSGTDLAFGVMPYVNGLAPYTDSNGGYLQGKLDDIGFWSRALSSQEVLSLYNSCSALISAQPSGVSVNVSANAMFTVIPTSTNVAFQWQVNTTSGFVNLSDAGQFSGVSTPSLNISGVSMGNNGQIFRCVLSSGNCSDTTQQAVLSVQNPNGVNVWQLKKKLMVYPVPFNHYLNVSGEGISEIIIKDVSGRILLRNSFNTTEKSGIVQLDLMDFEKGVYFLETKLNNGQGQVVKVIKE
jgi:hypothetical protein